MEKTYQNFVSNNGNDPELEFESKLIRTVYNFKWLYDSHHPEFNNVNKNRLSWARVAQYCQRPFIECTNKWNSLLQTYFSAPSTNWIHLEDLRKFEPYLSSNLRILSSDNKPNETQKKQLLQELLINSSKLRSPETTAEEIQHIWLMVSALCNAIKPGAYYPSLKWQKYWYDIKQDFGKQWIMRTKLNAMGTNIDLSNDEIKILEICGATTNDSLSDISIKLGNNIEFGSTRNTIVSKCNRCGEQPNELIINGHCEECRKLPCCDICHVPCDNSIIKYKITYWNPDAKSLLPAELQHANDISVCNDCSRILNIKATNKWKTCRICDTEQGNMQNLFDPALAPLRKAFNAATRFSFSESDGLPGYICKVCKIQIQQLTNFYTKFWRTQAKLRTKHSVNFIGTAVYSNPNAIINLNANRNQKPQISILNKKTQNDPLTINLETPTSATGSASPASSSTTTKTQQQNPVLSYKVTAAIPGPNRSSSFKRICIQKPGTLGKEFPIKNVIQEQVPAAAAAAGSGVKSSRNIPLNPPLAIKEIFSLQPSIQKSTTPAKAGTKASISVIPTSTLQQQQQTKVDEVFSNNTVTVTRKTVDLITPTAQTPQLLAATTTNNSPQQSNNAANLSNGGSSSNIPLQSGKNILTLNRGITITKRLPPHPVPPTTTEEKNPPNRKEINFIPLPSKVTPSPSSNTVSSASQLLSSKPGIFTIPDYETIEDAPPVFCIPKNASKNSAGGTTANTCETEAEKQLMNFNPSNAPVIKTEVFDIDEKEEEEEQQQQNEEYFMIESNTDPEPYIDENAPAAVPVHSELSMENAQQPEPSMENVPVLTADLPPAVNEPSQCTEPGMKVIRLNGTMVTVKPHPFISEAFLPVDLTGNQLDKNPNRLPSYIRKVTAIGSKSPANTNSHKSEVISAIIPKKSPSTTPMIARQQPRSTTINPPKQILAISKQPNIGNTQSSNVLTSEQVSSLVQSKKYIQPTVNTFSDANIVTTPGQAEFLSFQQHPSQQPKPIPQQQPMLFQRQPQTQKQFLLQELQQLQKQQQALIEQQPLLQQQQALIEQQQPLLQQHSQQLQNHHQQQPLQQQSLQHQQQVLQHQQQPLQHQQQPLQHQQQPQQHQQQPLQQQQQQKPLQSQEQQHQLGLKKPRKYWGTVDEFQVAPILTKSPPPPLILSPSRPRTQTPNQVVFHQQSKGQAPSSTPPWIEERRTPAPSEDPLTLQRVPLKTDIKQEVVEDNDVEIVSVTQQAPPPPSKDTQQQEAGMFYPDQFELENLTFGADMSSMINDLIINQNAIINNTVNVNNFNFMNAPAPIAGEKRKHEDPPNQEQETGERKRRREENMRRETRAQAEKKLEADKNKEPASVVVALPAPLPTPTQPAAAPSMKLRNLRVKLKRDKQDNKHSLISRPKRSCTLQQSPVPTVGKRKSLRLNQS